MPRRAKTTRTLKPKAFKGLIAAEAVASVLIQGVEGGFRIVIGFGDEEKPLGLAREDRERLFKTLPSAVNHLDKLGIGRANVEWTRHAPPPQPARKVRGPGRAAARERTEQAVAHDAAFRKSVGDALAQIKAGTVEIIPLSKETTEAMRARVHARVEAKRRARVEAEND